MYSSVDSFCTVTIPSVGSSKNQRGSRSSSVDSEFSSSLLVVSIRRSMRRVDSKFTSSLVRFCRLMANFSTRCSGSMPWMASATRRPMTGKNWPHVDRSVRDSDRYPVSKLPCMHVRFLQWLQTRTGLQGRDLSASPHPEYPRTFDKGDQI